MISWMWVLLHLMACSYTDWGVDFFCPQISHKKSIWKAVGKITLNILKARETKKKSSLQATCGVSFLLPFKYVLLQLSRSHVILHKCEVVWNTNYILFVYRMIQIWGLVQWFWNCKTVKCVRVKLRPMCSTFEEQTF